MEGRERSQLRMGLGWVVVVVEPEWVVVGCIDADFCNEVTIFQHFSRSTVGPIGRKKVRPLFFSRKKRTFGKERAWVAI